jgi:hypothetical protein
MQETRGYNPYKFGVVGASDSHNTASGYSQSDYFGGHGLMDATPESRLSGKKEAGLAMDRLSTAGLGGVWAEENTRESIFSAMQRNEVFATSGVRMQRNAGTAISTLFWKSAEGRRCRFSGKRLGRFPG